MSIAGIIQATGKIAHQVPQGTKTVLDIVAGAAVGVSWLAVAQSVVTLVSTIAGLVWIIIRICETETYKNWRKKGKKNA